jgi:hypothetical protein
LARSGARLANRNTLQCRPKRRDPSTDIEGNCPPASRGNEAGQFSPLCEADRPHRRWRRVRWAVFGAVDANSPLGCARVIQRDVCSVGGREHPAPLTGLDRTGRLPMQAFLNVSCTRLQLTPARHATMVLQTIAPRRCQRTQARAGRRSRPTSGATAVRGPTQDPRDTTEERRRRR